ncbi:Hsp20/alpha crystallin family protein [Cellulophaga baltica]|uniref:Hsp20/alpha crystallin family protein n=1 Tax=Cellulophaga TaxID=104264 RepID=UPI001C075C81|nr:MULTISPECIES: Hsp20/alpha crystallin family protein [Cellulophaga]MBU2996849.1 Hsp20/alpha crystallin family protein [Cellulophaga baltica]MDO6768246.1 Hsp20/alpha crystallin family protein [Cellulophaga sp. 1_MG-2023]
MSTVNKNLDFPALMNEIFNPDWFGGAQAQVSSKLPAVNIRESDLAFELELIVPGRKKEDFKIEVDNELLTISSDSKVEKETEENDTSFSYRRKEFSFSAFKRAFNLPETIDTDKIEANYENGVLSFDLPKKEEALPKPKRVIGLN